MAKKSFDIETKAQPAGDVPKNEDQLSNVDGFQSSCTGTEIMDTLFSVSGIADRVTSVEGRTSTLEGNVNNLINDLTTKKDDKNITFDFTYNATTNEFGYKIGNDFHPFSNARALYEALQYSPLATQTEDRDNHIYKVELTDTFKEMCAALANHFPNCTELNDYTGGEFVVNSYNSEGRKDTVLIDPTFDGTANILRTFYQDNNYKDATKNGTTPGVLNYVYYLQGRKNIVAYYEYDRWVLQLPKSDSGSSYIVLQNYASNSNFSKFFNPNNTSARMKIKGIYLVTDSENEIERTFRIDTNNTAEQLELPFKDVDSNETGSQTKQELVRDRYHKIVGLGNSTSYWKEGGSWNFKEGSVNSDNTHNNTYKIINSAYNFEIDLPIANKIRFSRYGGYSNDLVFCTISFYNPTSAT